MSNAESSKEAFGVGDAEAEAGLVAPRIGLLDVDPYDLSDTLADQSRDPAVSAAAVEDRFVSLEREPELVETAQPVATLARRQAARVLTA